MEPESSSSIEKRSIADDMAKPHVATQDVDVAAGLTAGKEVHFTPEEAARVRYVCVYSRRSSVTERRAGGRLTGI